MEKLHLSELVGKLHLTELVEKLHLAQNVLSLTYCSGSGSAGIAVFVKISENRGK